MFKILLFSLLAIVLFLTLLYTQFNLTNIERWVRWQYQDVPQLSTAELEAWLADNQRTAPQLLDVRTRAEYDVSHISGAFRVSPNAEPAAVLQTVDANRPIVLYCAVGQRSSKLGEKLIAAGRKDVWNLEGSIFAWANEGKSLVRDGETVTEVHPVNRFYGLLLNN